MNKIKLSFFQRENRKFISKAQYCRREITGSNEQFQNDADASLAIRH